MKIAKFILVPLLCIIANTSHSSSLWVKPNAGLNSKEKLDFWTGFGLFRDPWVKSPASTKGRDGLGPLFNARACMDCHKNGSGGTAPDLGFGAVLRLSDTANKPLVNYGSQLQTDSTEAFFKKHDLTNIQPEGKIQLTWQERLFPQITTSQPLRTPQLQLKELAYGSIPNNTRMSLRLAPLLFGSGALNTIKESTLLANADPEDKNKDGISGKVNYVLDVDSNSKAIGRFGWKAEHPNLKQQIAAAFNADIGITSTLFPKQNCTSSQHKCLNAIHGNDNTEGVEISAEKLDLVTTFVASLAINSSHEKNTIDNPQGSALFTTIQCGGCHLVSIEGEDGKAIHPYTDLLLHDMGTELSDKRPVADASGNEWRTPPLWGMKRKLKNKRAAFLHDGRARTLEEAILWHGGEAEQSRSQYIALNKADKEALLKFVGGL